MTLRTERPPVRPRSGRRPLPPLIFLLVLAVAAGARLVERPARRTASARPRQAAACASVEEAPPSLDPTTVSVRVHNATDQAGLAQKVADDLQEPGLHRHRVRQRPQRPRGHRRRRGPARAARRRRRRRSCARLPARRRRLPRRPRHRRGRPRRSDRSSPPSPPPRRWRRRSSRRRGRPPPADPTGRRVTPACSAATRPTNSSAIDGAATIAIGSANGRPGRPATTRPGLRRDQRAGRVVPRVEVAARSRRPPVRRPRSTGPAPRSRPGGCRAPASAVRRRRHPARAAAPRGSRTRWRRGSAPATPAGSR